MDSKRRGGKKIIKTFKDYIAPIFIVFLILIVIINYIFSSKENIVKQKNQEIPLNIVLNNLDTEAYIIYPGGNKTKIQGNLDFFKQEKVQVVKGEINIDIPNNGGNLKLNRLGELKYNENGNFTLYSSDLWVNNKNNINIDMRYAKVSANTPSVFSLSQNEVASSIFVVSGFVEVKNLAGKSTNVQKGEKLIIMRNNSNDNKSDLSLSKEPIDDYIKNDDWFIKNNGNFYLSNKEQDINSTGSLKNIDGGNLSNYYISFINLYDEQDLGSDTINIEGNILSDIVYKVDIAGQQADINNENKTFSLKNFKLSNKINDIVYKIYDNESKLLYKGVITLYNSKGNTNNFSKLQNSSSLAQVQNYPITTSPLYQIISPKQNPYITKENLVMLEGTVPARTVEKIVINGFQLQQFPKNGTYWKYFANSEFGNLKEGVNIYKIQYFGPQDKLIYENNFTIIKEPKNIESQKIQQPNIQSNIEIEESKKEDQNNENP